MIKAVIFDLDGTLSDTLSTIAHYGNIALNHCGLPSVNVDEYKYFAGDGKKVLIRRMLEFHNSYSDELFEKVEKKYDTEYENNVLLKTSAFEGISELLQALKKSGIKLAVLSNKPDNVTAMIVDMMFPDIFDICFGKKENIEKKPHPEGVNIILKELGVKASESLFVGDTNVDIQTAKNSNMLSIGVLWGFRDFNELKSEGADFIVKSPDEILEIILKIENE